MVQGASPADMIAEPCVRARTGIMKEDGEGGPVVTMALSPAYPHWLCAGLRGYCCGRLQGLAHLLIFLLDPAVHAHLLLGVPGLDMQEAQEGAARRQVPGGAHSAARSHLAPAAVHGIQGPIDPDARAQRGSSREERGA